MLSLSDSYGGVGLLKECLFSPPQGDKFDPAAATPASLPSMTRTFDVDYVLANISDQDKIALLAGQNALQFLFPLSIGEPRLTLTAARN